jgi:hypothetical protein
MKHTVLHGLAAIAMTAGIASAQVFTYPNFSDVSGLKLNGSAAQNGNKLTLTPALENQGGSAFSLNTISLAANASFSSFFAFDIQNRGGLGNGADGLVFTVQTNSNSVGGVGGGLGYQGIPNSVGVEFDTFDNGEPGGSNHVGIDDNGSVSSLVSTAELTPDFDNAATWFAWVDYNGATQRLSVRWASTAVRPSAEMLGATLDLPTILGATNVFAGFTAATGAGWGQHNIDEWSFVDSFQPGGAPNPSLTATPEPGSMILATTGLGLVGVIVRRRRKNTV